MNTLAQHSPERSFELKLLILVWLVLSLASWLRLRLVILDWKLLPELGASADPWYLAASAVAWGTLSLVCSVGLIFHQWWAPSVTRAGAIALALWYWVDRLVLDQTSVAQQNWLFSAGLTLVSLIFVLGVLALPAQKAYFKR